MGNKIRRIFCPTEEEQLEDLKQHLMLHEKLKVKKGCSTCEYCVHIRNYPGFVTAEECECTAGLECDTVLFSVENCPKWQEKKFNLKDTNDLKYKYTIL